MSLLPSSWLEQPGPKGGCTAVGAVSGHGRRWKRPVCQCHAQIVRYFGCNDILGRGDRGTRSPGNERAIHITRYGPSEGESARRYDTLCYWAMPIVFGCNPTCRAIAGLSVSVGGAGIRFVADRSTNSRVCRPKDEPNALVCVFLMRKRQPVAVRMSPRPSEFARGRAVGLGVECRVSR